MRVLRVVLVSVVLGLTAACGLFFPSEDEAFFFRAGHAVVGGRLVLYVPLCAGESLDGVYVKDTTPPPDADGPWTAPIVWSVVGPNAELTRSGVVVVGDDSGWDEVVTPLGELSNSLEVRFRVETSSALIETDTGFPLDADYFPHHPAKTDPSSIEFYFGVSNGKGDILSIAEMDEAAECAAYYRHKILEQN
ncbi:hypothetical protein [Stackebrandtia soli]|uniref:hypothetical protein n=1 Tax=Stackebrandtia soli TaxID=1892856 RepID=UPI0039E8A151